MNFGNNLKFVGFSKERLNHGLILDSNPELFKTLSERFGVIRNQTGDLIFARDLKVIEESETWFQSLGFRKWPGNRYHWLS
jgi:hypothetical protein